MVPMDYQTQFEPTEKIWIKGDDTHKIKSDILKMIFLYSSMFKIVDTPYTHHI
jgi:hypothetical protein